MLLKKFGVSLITLHLRLILRKCIRLNLVLNGLIKHCLESSVWQDSQKSQYGHIIQIFNALEFELN